MSQPTQKQIEFLKDLVLSLNPFKSIRNDSYKGERDGMILDYSQEGFDFLFNLSIDLDAELDAWVDDLASKVDLKKFSSIIDNMKKVVSNGDIEKSSIIRTAIKKGHDAGFVSDFITWDGGNFDEKGNRRVRKFRILLNEDVYNEIVK